ncbi:Serine/threonine protein phosphatase PrpC [Pedobacter steynii]|uniref:Serine/threonine protein phosphatase PrpC n=1 Tax=Pedobacter steynii TaxID=430522 RepID=A0A1H0K043_9SPHI|nr:protein phosphatase 2C domain-containing protein [Pedobacter steynii]NQX43212.1 serine/threonine-protein phosphatase [Pedobacter steynii]SDO49316.1 Serine/threonine protein phosphatase PrpC [Pedobacter steynii]
MDNNYFGITDTGKVRDNNEDTFIAERTSDNDFVIACVIDGVGGYSGGEIAADITRKSILHHLAHPKADLPGVMKEAILAADAQIILEKQRVKGHENMACVFTLAVVDLHKNKLYYIHVGDTRLYLLRDNSLIKISKDQSFVGFMEDSGRLTEEQAMQHPKRNEINKALGFGMGMAGQEDYLETGESPFLPGDLLLLCSDGLSDMVNSQEMIRILTMDNSIKEKGAQLINAANQNGGLDNITVVLVKNDKQSLVHEATKPAAKSKKSVPAPVVVDHASPPQAQPLQKRNKNTVALLSGLCLILLAACVYLFWQKHQLSNPSLPVKTVHSRNAQELKLQDALNNLKGNTLTLTDSVFKSPIILTESLHFTKDSLFLIAKNQIVIKSDSAFRGNAMIIQSASSYVYLENLTFEDFNTAISSQNNALVLKNIQFKNSPNAIQTIYELPAKGYINGKISRSSFKADSIPNTSK